MSVYNINEWKDFYKILKFVFHVQVMETQYQNLYAHLFLFNHGSEFDASLLTKRNESMPELTLLQAPYLQSGSVSVVSPPPHLTYKSNSNRVTPKGKYICCITNLNDMVKKELIAENGMEVGNEKAETAKAESEDMEQEWRF